ncbi:orange carotenoid protein N-terminal domain-containing protein [Phormidium sp. CCY1219]|uniref:orange carotenoid protein N-terminal domain-containing protein n=1 Tax=Phormidium sp. CCY1219 TaxID=2886104 RepID=UPI002D1E5AC7|nr:orange carotenoid protein N-terminal domain-containing protein [Phormidium sp. CCY1219]MEB3830338.1 orange carotenoid protein [Phormidium sp. CCY1219]
MSSINTSGKTQIRSENTQKIVQAFEGLGTDDKLAVLYWVYEKMGDSITPAAPTAANPQVAPILLDNFYNLSKDEQLNVMRDIVNRKDTEYSRDYGALSANNQLLVWYAWAVAMGDRVVDMPNDYEATEGAKNFLSQIENAEFEEQISILREAAMNMGYSEVGEVPSQSETGKTPSL